MTPALSVDERLVPGLRMPRADLLSSGQPTVDAWPVLAARGVVAVVNLRPDAEMAGRDETAEVQSAGMAYHRIPVDGMAGLSLEKARALRPILRDAGGAVLVHCASGNRVGALVALAAADAGEPLEQALQMGREAGMASTEARVRELLLGAPGQP